MRNKRSHGEGSISHRSNGTWLAQVTVNGKRVSHTFKQYKDAQDWIAGISDHVKKDVKTIIRETITVVDEIVSVPVVKKNKDRTKNDMRRLKKYGLLISQYDEMIVVQSNKCAVCHSELIVPHIDHDHVTGKVRGLLCSRCNIAIGFMKDSPITALEIAKYLINNRGV